MDKWATLKNYVTKKLQKVCWLYLTDNYEVSKMTDFRMVEPRVKCVFTPITFENCKRVLDFREQGRISEYKYKLAHNEIGFFAESDSGMIGSIWATKNYGKALMIVRAYMPLMPSEALIHDIVTCERYRGMAVGPFMVGNIAETLLNKYGASKIIIDVGVRNRSSLRMMEKSGMHVKQRVLYISAFGKLAFTKVLRQYD